MRDTDDIIRDLQNTSLNKAQLTLIKELTNTLGSQKKQIKDEILELINIECGKMDVISVDDLRNIILRAGNDF